MITAPTDIAGCILWVRGDGSHFQDAARTTAASSDGDPIGSLSDESGNADHASTITAGEFPTLQTAELNGLAVVRFDGGDSLQSAADAGQKPRSCFAVVNPTNFSLVRTILGPSTAGAFVWKLTTGGAQTIEKASTAAIGTGAGTFSAATWAIAAVTYDGSGNYVFRKDRAADGSGTNNQTLNAAGTQIGTNQGTGSSENFLGDIAEVVVYDTALTGTNLTDVEDYLATRWGLGGGGGGVTVPALDEGMLAGGFLPLSGGLN